MATEQDQLPPIEPLHERWEPNPDPMSIDVPGLDTNAPVQDQIEQIEQLITIKLQNIDANFARAHQILSTRILPAVRRFAVNTEPVREAARFWVSFFEQAAQVRIPTTEDFSNDFEQHSQSQEESAEAANLSEHHSDEPEKGSNATVSENSFASGEALVSSTPMTQSRSQTRSHVEETPPSWAASLESPLDRLDRGLRSLREDDEPLEASQQSLQAPPSVARESQAPPSRQPIFTAASKGKGKQQQPTLLQNVLSKNLKAAGPDPSSPVSPAKSQSRISPLKIKPKTPKSNPYVSSSTHRADWDGIIDLKKSATPRRGHDSAKQDWDSDEQDSDESADFLPPGMSPPVTMDFARVPRSAGRSGASLLPAIGRSPAKEAAARIRQDLVNAAERGRSTFGIKYNAYGAESSLSSAPSAPSLTMYSKRALGIDGDGPSSSLDPSLESMMRQVGLGSTGHGSAVNDSFDNSSFDQTPPPQGFFNNIVNDDGAEIDSDSDSSEEAEPGAPSAAFIMASQHAARRMSDDSFGSSNDSFSEDEEVGGAVHPAFAGGNTEEDGALYDSSDEDDMPVGNEEEPTVFGMRAAQMASTRSGGELRLHGENVLDDTDRFNSRSNVVPETPTPFGTTNTRPF